MRNESPLKNPTSMGIHYALFRPILNPHWRLLFCSAIADIMTDVVDEGDFLGKTIINYTNKMQKAKELLEGIDPDFSVAEKTLATLCSYDHIIIYSIINNFQCLLYLISLLIVFNTDTIVFVP